MSEEAAVTDVTSEAPDTPEASQEAPVTDVTDAPASSPREAIEKAFETLGQEDKTNDAPQPEAGKTEPQKSDDGKQPRGPDGKFASKDKPEVAGEAAQVAAEVQPEVTLQPEPEKPVEPVTVPNGIAVSPDEWAKFSPEARAWAERREAEVAAGFAEKNAQLEPIQKYIDQATQSGTTLPEALERYTTMEQALRDSPVQAMFHICQNIGYDPKQMVTAMAQALTGQNPDALKPIGDPPEIKGLKEQINEIQSMMNGFKSTLTERDALSQIEAFRAKPEHPHFDALESSITDMLETGFAKNLEDAYQKALLLHPEVAQKASEEAAAEAAKQKHQPDPARTQEKAALSPTGSPSPGSHPATAKPSGSAREAASKALAQVGIS